ncbi:kinesin-like protein KIN-4A [Curcuma longa]|uniref:kinesin-like protein KIN-4A n=1 Tax=Curcuma longa TaxID=136217 RepID=UPI003D9F1BE9
MNSEEHCCVKVAVHIRPLIEDERLQGCKECVVVVPGKPQVQIGSHSFTFDHVYGSTCSPSSAMFDECVAPLVDGLFDGYNATILAYGQTGSGKTYTMGTGFKESSQTGLIPHVMNALFSKIETLKHQTEFHLRVSFIEILKEEVRDLLDSTTVCKVEVCNGQIGKVATPGKSPVQIRESSNGIITLSGSTEVDVSTQNEMAACLEQGSISRATGSTNMNNQSSRSHAIFTITLEQLRKINPCYTADGSPIEEISEDFLCAKLHLVDLAGSERAKRTGSHGLRFKEGVHINKGLLALGTVISALGDERKRKEGGHVPYRDSKLTRLLQDSLGGNSRTVMIACISPADVNAEETLNTLKYANRARNIENKPIVNRNPISDEIQRMHQHIESLQAELACSRSVGTTTDEIQVLKDRISWLEATNEDLCRELYEYRNCQSSEHFERDFQKGRTSFSNIEGLRRSLQSTEKIDYEMVESLEGDSSSGSDEEIVKEWEYQMSQDSMGKELKELNRQLEQKESEMKMFGSNCLILKQHFGKKLMELEEEKKTVQRERDRLLALAENPNANPDGQTHKLPENYMQKLKTLETQIRDLKKKQENHVQLLKQKQRRDEAAKKLQDEIQFIKAQKVQLQHKMKQEAGQFRQWKASREKELQQLRREGRRSEYERRKLQGLNQRQKMVLQRKTEEAAMATKKLKELLEARKSSSRENPVYIDFSFTLSINEKTLQQWLDHEVEVLVHMHEVQSEYEKQSKMRASLANELSFLKQEQVLSEVVSSPGGRMKLVRVSSMSPSARLARTASLENMVAISSNTLVAMAAQLSKAEERERAFTGRGRWNQLRSLGDAKCLLQYMFNVAADSRCQLKEKEIHVEELKEQLNELIGLLQRSDARRREMEKEPKLREHNVAIAVSTSSPMRSNGSMKNCTKQKSPSPIPLLSQKQLNYTAGITSSPIGGTPAFNKQQMKMVPIGHLSMGKKVAAVGQGGKLWRWKRSHHQWLLQFKWKWQKPWRLSEWIRHSDETIMRTQLRTHRLRSIV